MTEHHDKSGLAPRHRSLAELKIDLEALAPAPKDSGRLALIVCRRAPGVHEALPSARLTREDGLAGDEWSRRPPCKPDTQLAIMRREVAELIAHGRPLSLFGDNLFVDLDISAANLPAGSRLRAGTAIVEVTHEPHDGCRKFHDRFGADALRFVQAPATRELNLRGIYWKVLEPGQIHVGASIRVLSRPKQPGPKTC